MRSTLQLVFAILAVLLLATLALMAVTSCGAHVSGSVDVKPAEGGKSEYDLCVAIVARERAKGAPTAVASATPQAPGL